MPNASAMAEFRVTRTGDELALAFSGDWVIGSPAPGFDKLASQLDQEPGATASLALNCQQLGQWDALFLSRVLQCAEWCDVRDISLDSAQLPEGAHKLLGIATAVKPISPQTESTSRWLRLSNWLEQLLGEVTALCSFVGELALALLALLRGASNSRARDFFYFVDQVGPKALGIVTLLSLLVGMILAYMGAVQLRQFGAQIYVADLVAIGMAREMGVLMTAVIMAGRTGAAYAAQLGTMQTNEEIDALQTLGISPMEYLVVPRVLALVCIMPLLVLYSDVLGVVGGSLVAMGLDIAPIQYFVQVRDAVGLGDILSGLVKSVVFALLVAIAGCQAGLQCGRSSEAVGLATTSAVVRAIVYLVVADALLNIIYDQLGI